MQGSSKTLILGGVKSGKSRYALNSVERYLQSATGRGVAAPEVVFIATARAGDAEMQRRIQRHQGERPLHWTLIEEPRHLSERLRRLSDGVASGERLILVDCLTLWLTQLSGETLDQETLEAECTMLVETVAALRYPIVLVSNELNMGVTPLGEFSRRFCDTAGLLHQSLAAVCDSVTLVVAGLPLKLKAGADPFT